MQTRRLVRSAVVLGLLSLSALSLAQGQTQQDQQAQQTQTTPVQFSDVPAGHWAAEAVAYIAQLGLIEGFPDGTFRGNQTLTRYQAALIFFRLLESGRMSQVPAQGQGTVQQGMQEVAAEMAALRTRFDALERSNADVNTRLQALEQQVRAQAAAPAGQASPELTTRLTALEQQVATLANRPATPAPANTELTTRLTALEQQVATLANRPAPAPAAPGADLTARLTALETRITELANRPAATAPAQPDPAVAAQAARIAALEQQVRTLNDQLGAQQRPQPQTPVVVVPPAAEPVAGPSSRNVYVGLGGNFSILPSSGVAGPGFGVSGMVGIKNLFLGLGPRVGVNYNLSAGILSAELNLIRSLNPDGFIDPYLGLGARLVLGSGGVSTTNIFGNGVLGVNVNFSNNLGAFIEANPRLEPGVTFGVGARAGLKVSF